MPFYGSLGTLIKRRLCSTKGWASENNFSTLHRKFKARLTPCYFRLLLDAETTKRRKSHGVSAPKTIVVRWFYQRDSCWTDSKIESVQLPSHCVSGSKTAVASTDRSQTNHSKAFSWRIADTNSWPIFSENGEGRRWGLIEWRRWKCVNRHVADEACPVWCDRLWRYYYWIPKKKCFCQNQFVFGSCACQLF